MARRAMLGRRDRIGRYIRSRNRKFAIVFMIAGPMAAFGLGYRMGDLNILGAIAVSLACILIGVAALWWNQEPQLRESRSPGESDWYDRGS